MVFTLATPDGQIARNLGHQNENDDYDRAVVENEEAHRVLEDIIRLVGDFRARERTVRNRQTANLVFVHVLIVMSLCIGLASVVYESDYSTAIACLICPMLTIVTMYRKGWRFKFRGWDGWSYSINGRQV